MRYKLHIPYVNRQDMLRSAVASVRDIGNIHVWASGTPAPKGLGAEVVCHELALMLYTATANTMIRSSWNDDVMLFMHADGIALNGAAEKFIRFVEETYRSPARWGVIFSCYDVLCAYNMKAVRSVGYWDPQYGQYTSDVDYYHRLRAAGWPSIESNLGANSEQECGVLHRNGSSSIKANPLFNLTTQYRCPYDTDYHKFKWGGYPGHEQYFYPFNGSYLEKLSQPTETLYALQGLRYNSDEGNLFDNRVPDELKAQLHTMFDAIIRYQPKRILETGTHKGYFGYLLSQLIEEFLLITCDSNAGSEEVTRVLGNQVRFVHGDTRETLPKLDGEFDLAWIDGGHDYAPALSDISQAIRLKIPCIMIDDTNVPSVAAAIRDAGLAATHHIVEPYAFQRDPRCMLVATMKC